MTRSILHQRRFAAIPCAIIGVAALMIAAMAPTGAEAQTQPAADVSSTNGAVLDVALRGTNDIWVAGYQLDANNGPTPLVEHFDGTTWTVAKTKLPRGHAFGILQSVVELGPDDVWVVGSASSIQNGPSDTLAEHWNGTSWKVVATPNPDGATYSSLQSVAAAPNGDVWAVGTFVNGDGGSIIERWDGSTWSLVPNADPAGAFKAGLQSVSISPLGDVWAAGFYFDGSGAGRTLVERWDGSAWQLEKTPNVAGSPDTELHAITVTATGVVWASGFAFTGSTYVPITLRLSHHSDKWRLVDAAIPAGSQNTYLYGISGFRSKDVWATGYSFSGGLYHTLAEHWNGKKWQVVTTPDLDGSNYLFGVQAGAQGTMWAAGFAASDHDTPFLMSFVGGSWTLQPLP